MSARSTTSVLAVGMSIPLSMIDVVTSTSASPARNASMTFSSARSAICPCATRTRAPGTSARTCSAAWSIVSTRLCR